MATTAAKFISQEDYDKGLQNYYQDLQKRTSRISASIKRAPQTRGRAGTARTISLRGPATLQQKAIREYGAIQQKEYDKNVIQAKQDVINEVNFMTFNQRFNYGDPTIKYLDLQKKRVYYRKLEGKTYNGKQIYWVHGLGETIGKPTIDYTESRSGDKQKVTGSWVKDGTIWTYQAYNNSKGNRRLKQVDTGVKYNPIGTEKFSNPDTWKPQTRTPFKYTWEAPPSPNLKPQFFSRYPKLVAGAINAPKVVSRDPSVLARQNLLASGQATATLGELRNKPQLFTSLPAKSIPTLSSGGMVLYGKTGKGYISGSNVAFPNEVSTPSFQKRTGFSERDAFASGVGLKIGEGSYNPSEIVNSFLDIKGGETLSQSAARVREDNIITQTLAEGERLKGNEWITQTKEVPVQLRSSSNLISGKSDKQMSWIGQDLAKELGMTNYGGPRQATKTTYQPSSLSGDFLSVPGGIYGVSGETKKTSPPLLYPGATDFNFDVTKEKDFRKKYGEATAGDVVRKLQAEGKADLKDVDRTRELVYGVAGVKVEKARKEIKDTRLLSDIETGFYSEYGKDFGTFKETTLTPENKKRINELNTLVNTLKTQTTEKVDGKTVKQLESAIKSQETTMLKSRDTYSTYITNLEGKSATKTQLKKIETLYDKSESDRKTYNGMLDKYGKRTDKINENVKKLDSYDDIIQQSNVEVKVRRDFIDELREKEKTLRETEPRFFDRIDRKPTGNKLKDTTSWIASAAIGSVNVIPKALTFRKSVKDYNLGLESYSELVKDYEKFDEIGKEKKPIPKQLDESLFYLTAKTSRPSEYDVAENIFAREGEGLKTTTKYFGGKARDYFPGLVRVGVMTRSFGGILVPSYNKKNKADEKARAKHLEETVLLTKPNKSDKYMFDLKNVLTKQSLASKPYVKYGKEHMASFLTATGKTPSQYTDYVFTPPKSQIVGRVKKYAKLTLGDPDVTAVAATVALPFVYSKFGFSVFNPSSTVTALTAAQTPLGEAASELTTAGITVASENVLGATGTYMGLKPATVGKMERLGGVAGNIGSFFVPGRSQMALMGLNVKTIKKKPVESALLIGMGGGFKAVQSYGGAYVSRKLTSPAFAKLSRKAPYFKAGTYSLGKADLYQMGLTVPGKVATYGLGAIYGASIYTRAANAKNKYESRKIGKQVEQEFALLGLGGKLASSVRPVGAWEAEGLKRHGELFNYGPDGAGPFRTKLFGKGTSIKQYAKKMGLVEEPKSWEDGILIKLGLKQPTLKPEARELANLYIKAGYIKPTTTKFKSDQYRSTVAKIMKKYGVDVYLKGSKVGGENIRGFRNVQKSDYDIIFSGSKAKFSKFKTEIANAIIKQNPTLTQETLGTQLKVKTSTGKDVINVQYSKTKAPRSNIINKKGIRMLSEDAWIKDKYSIIAQLQQKPLLSNKQIAKLEQKLISNTNTIKTIQKGTKFKNKKQLNKLLKENEKIELQLKDKMKLKSLTAKQAGKLNQALRDVKAYENRELQITEKGLKKFEDRLTQFDALYKSSQRSVEDYGLNPKAKYRINPKEIDVFKKDAKPFDVFRDAMVRFKAKLGGSTTRLSAIGKGTRAKTLVSEPSDLDIYVKNQKAMRIFIEKGLKAKGYKLLKPEQKITKKNQFKIDQGKAGFEVILKDGKVQVHGEDMLYQNLFSVSSKSPFKPLFEKTPEGIMIPKYELQARRELFGAFGDSRASKDLPKFITGQKALALEMTTRRKITSKDYLSQLFGSKKTSGRSTKFKRSTSQKPAAEKYGREFERLNLRFLERSKDTLRMNLLQRKELSKLPELMKRVKGKPLFIKQQKGKQTEYKYKGLMPPLEPVTYAPSQKSSKRTKLNEGYKYFNEGGLYGGGYKKLDSSYKYTKDYKKYPGYDTYDPYKPYKPYKPVKPYDGGGSYKPYKEYDEYTSYPTYPTYNTYNTYSTYGYDYYKQTPPTTTPAKPPFGFDGGGRQRSRKKPMGYQIKTFGILKLYEEFNKPKIRKTKGNDKFKIL